MAARTRNVWVACFLLIQVLVLGQPTAAATGCTSGSSGIGDGYYPYMGNSGYDARDYLIDLDLDVDGGAITSGVVTMTAQAEIGLCRFNLDFHGLEIDAVSVDGQPATWTRIGQELTIQPAAPIAAGATFVVETRYHGTPFTLETSRGEDIVALLEGLATPGALESPDLATPVAAGDELPGVDDGHEGASFMIGASPDAGRYGRSLGGWWTTPGQIFIAGEPRGSETWYPVNGHPADKATYTLRLTVDAPYDVVANGERVSLEEQDGRRTATWVAAEPMASYLVTFYAGDIDIVIEDAESDGPLYRYAYGAAVEDWQREQLEDLTPEIIDFFEERFGPYPFEVAGGMIVDGVLWFALETQTIPIHSIQIEAPEFGFTREEIMGPVEETIAHEIAHQWFGNLVSPLRWRDVYLNEGLTQYATYLWIEHRDGSAVMESRLRDTYDRMVVAVATADPAFIANGTGKDLFGILGELGEMLAPEVQAALGAASREEVDALPAETVLEAIEGLGLDREGVLGPAPVLTGNPGPEDNFSMLWIYERGALATHALRVAIGDDAFFRVMQAWTGRHGGGSATVQDFIALAEQESGQDLDSLFDAWLFREEMPPFPVSVPGVEATPEAAATPEG